MLSARVSHPILAKPGTQSPRKPLSCCIAGSIDGHPAAWDMTLWCHRTWQWKMGINMYILYTYIYIYTCVYMYVYVYIYISSAKMCLSY